jgi:hypothetical protein
VGDAFILLASRHVGWDMVTRPGQRVRAVGVTSYWMGLVGDVAWETPSRRWCQVVLVGGGLGLVDDVSASWLMDNRHSGNANLKRKINNT